MIHLSRPDITEREIQAVVEVLRSPNLSLGPKVPEFEVGRRKICRHKIRHRGQQRHQRPIPVP